MSSFIKSISSNKGIIFSSSFKVYFCEFIIWVFKIPSYILISFIYSLIFFICETNWDFLSVLLWSCIFPSYFWVNSSIWTSTLSISSSKELFKTAFDFRSETKMSFVFVMFYNESIWLWFCVFNLPSFFFTFFKSFFILSIRVSSMTGIYPSVNFDTVSKCAKTYLWRS